MRRVSDRGQRRGAILLPLCTFLVAAAIAGFRSPAGAASPAVSVPATTVTSATLFAQSAGLLLAGASALPSTPYPGRLYLSPTTGSTFNVYRDSNHLDAIITQGKQTFDINVQPHSGTVRAGDRVDVELGGVFPSCSASTDGLVREVRQSRSGTVASLDVVFAQWCGASQYSGYVLGELQIDEPVTTVARSMPGSLLFPPTALESSRRTYPIRIYAATGTHAISTIALTGSSRAYFTVTSDSCTGQEVTTTRYCTVWVRYRPHDSEDLANLVARDGTGRVMSSTPLDAAAIPGNTYWATTFPVSAHMQDVQVATPSSRGWMSVGAAATNSANTELFGQVSSPQLGAIIIAQPLGASTGLHRGTYPVDAANAPVYLDAQLGNHSYPWTSGTIRITHLNGRRRDRGFYYTPDIAFTFELKSPLLPAPVYGAVGYATTTPMVIPGISAPPTPTDVTAHRDGTHIDLTWQASADIAVDRYAIRAERGRHSTVALTSGHRRYSGTAASASLDLPRSSSTPTTLTIYSFDDNGHHSQGRTIIIDN